MIIYGSLGAGSSPKPLVPADPGYDTQQFPANQGQFQLRYVGKNIAMQSLAGDAYETSYLGTSRTYNIAGGKIVADLAGTPIETTVYKVGDKYLAARSNEAGFVNYEITEPEAELNALEPSAGQSRPK